MAPKKKINNKKSALKDFQLFCHLLQVSVIETFTEIRRKHCLVKKAPLLLRYSKQPQEQLNRRCESKQLCFATWGLLGKEVPRDSYSEEKPNSRFNCGLPCCSQALQLCSNFHHYFHPQFVLHHLWVQDLHLTGPKLNARLISFAVSWCLRKLPSVWPSLKSFIGCFQSCCQPKLK